MNKIPCEVFEKLWEQESLLGCPVLKSPDWRWLFPLPEDPCKKKICGKWMCRNYERGFDEPDRLYVPEKPMPELLLQHLEKWMKEFTADEELKAFYKDLKKVVGTL